MIDLKILVNFEIEKSLLFSFLFKLVIPMNKILARTKTASKTNTNEYDNLSERRPPITIPQLKPAILPMAAVERIFKRVSALLSNIAHNFVEEINAAIPRPRIPLANENLKRSLHIEEVKDPTAANIDPNIINFCTPNLLTANKQINKPIIVVIALVVVGKLNKKLDPALSLLNNL